MLKLIKYAGAIIMGLSFFVILGTAGADCDGDCMENSLTITQTLLNIAMASTADYVGYLMYKYGDDYLG